MQLTSFCGLSRIYTNTRNETIMWESVQTPSMMGSLPTFLASFSTGANLIWSFVSPDHLCSWQGWPNQALRVAHAVSSAFLVQLLNSVSSETCVSIFQSLLHTHLSSFRNYKTHLSLLPHCSCSTFHNRPLAWNGGFVTPRIPVARKTLGTKYITVYQE